jgi:dienelactone hydrolase
MIHRFGATLIALFLVAAGAQAAEPIAQPPGLVREAFTVPYAPTGTTLEAQITRPAGAGKHPLIVLSHGAPRDANDRVNTSPTGFSAVAIEFARRGWAVAAVVRRGYGRSGGPYVEGSGPCKTPDYVKSGRASAADVVEAIKVLQHQPYVDGARVMLVGISAGGFASIAAAAEKPPGVVAVLNFAGGRGSDAPDSVCRADLLVDAYATFGKTIRIPTLWVYSENDHFFGPKLARRFFTAFTEAGGTGEFVALPAFGEDGHRLLTAAGVPLWRDRVDAFLRQHQLPTWPKPVVEAHADLKLPPHLSASGRESFERYLASSGFEKAFAISQKGGYGWTSGRRTPEEAAHEALAVCAKNASDCRIYAVNDALAR